MSMKTIELGDDSVLQPFNQPVQRTAQEFVVLELYRRGSISSGKAAELLGMSRWHFIHHASDLGIPLFDMSEDEWAAEQAASEKL
jgi:predicted HTH domain antitoxin